MTQSLTNVHPERAHQPHPEQNDSGKEIGEGSEQHSRRPPLENSREGCCRGRALIALASQRGACITCVMSSILVRNPYALTLDAFCVPSVLSSFFPLTPCQCSTPPPW
ncbi:hypothetical protein NPIL_595611 [Nephila pilipes]|uniref:Uncharacterized protein n=1 Tax=Nephila pilipes TaxID=299642 RepID=A0A8X6N0Z2_NEPPI|nr:hypothetical protein NPIL_595611 [Nephila pilipes]